jgi:DNA-binding transcriptional LysR family regulator
MPDSIPIELLRTFIAIADTGSFSLAADQISRTQSAVSMQIKRLEELLEKSLIHRDSRNLQLTSDGVTLLQFARRILKLNEEALSLLKRPELKGWVSIGLPDDYAARFLPEILANFSRTHPRVQVKVTCEPSNILLERIRKKDIDLAIVTSPAPEAENGILLRQDPIVWVTSERHCQHEITPLPLALFSGTCYCRNWILSALDKAGVEHRIAYTSPSIMGLQAAVTAGLAVSAISQSIVWPGIRQLSPEQGFPSLPNAYLMLRRNPESNNCIVDSLADHICKAFSNCSEFGGCLA